jgi:Na+-transporting methylmalonyl-CoA/oxaloacetate decarboxylase gamma subunit
LVPQENVPQGNALQVDASKPTDAVAASSPAAAKPIEQSDAPSIPQENDPQGSTPQVDGFKPTDTVATSSHAAAKPIEQSDASSIPQQNDPQGSTLQVDGFKPTDTVATSSPAAVKPIEQSDAPSIPQQNDPQGSTPQVDGFKPTDTVATSSPAAVKPIEQSDAPSIPQQNDGSKPTDAGVASSPATPTFRVAAAGADSAPPDADSEVFDDGRRIAERSNPTIKADIVRGLSFEPVQIFLLLVLGVAIVVFLISLVILMHHRVTALIEFQLDHERPEAQAKHGWQDDRADARSSQMFVDNWRGQDGIDAPPWRVRPSATRPQNGEASSTEPPRSSVEDVNAALEDLKAALIYEDRTQRFHQGPESPMAP